ncbi:MAG: hypothetical protein CVU47_06385 [Chloroflexi bacterium HGW-Chloroflexi-9]|nr:MAG: hypothetical protein CVU47_06385 [Chloroflexi bacterium HGW-Chloroflexi-9]
MVMTATRMSVSRVPKVRAVQIAVTTTGSAGSATGNATSPIITGQILGVYVNWHASAPAGTSDITVEGATTGLDLYAKANAVTDVYKVPSAYGLDAAATALTSDVTPQRVCINEGVKVTVAQSDALTNCAIVTVVYRPLMAEQVAVTTTGEAGSAEGNADSAHIVGEILGLAINYHASTPATADIVIKTKTASVNLYAKDDTTTDAFAVPVIFGVSAANAGLSSDVTPQHYCIADKVNVALAQGDALTAAVTVTIFYAPLQAIRIPVTTTGAAGSASGSATVAVEGEILGLFVTCHASLPAGTADITVSSASGGHTIWARSNSATSVFVAPRIYGVSVADGALSGNVTPEPYAEHGGVTVAVAQGDALTDAVIVDVFVRP